MTKFSGIVDDWDKFEKELSDAEKKHNDYLKLLKELNKQQENCSKSLKHLQYTFSQIQNDVKKVKKSKEPLSEEETKRLAELDTRLKETRIQLDEREKELPVSDIGLYLTIILGGNLNVSLLNPEERYKYKKDYEKFKTTVTYVIIVLLTFSYFIPYRTVDALTNFTMVWYYCTLTIREAILRVNGSRIKGWWIAHHYFACVLCGITLTWRDRSCYKDFRPWFLIVSFYISLVQLMQSSYQTASLRRLRSLGERFDMDVTLEGFSSWMFKGLTFLLPFLLIGYLIQAYCSYYLFHMYYQRDCSEDWQVLALAILFAIISCGNILTMGSVFIRKIFHLKVDDLTHLVSKYRPKFD